MSLLTISGLMADYEINLDKLQFKYRKLILENVLRYLVYTYPSKNDLNLDLKYAIDLVQDRITHFHHYTKQI